MNSLTTIPSARIPENEESRSPRRDRAGSSRAPFYAVAALAWLGWLAAIFLATGWRG